MKGITPTVLFAAVTLSLAQGAAEVFAQQSENPSDNPPVAKPLSSVTEKAEASKPQDLLTSFREQIEAAPLGPERNRLRLGLVERLVAAGRRAEASNELRVIQSGQEFDPQGLYNAANAFARLGDSEQAINTYRKAIDQRRGNYSRALNNLGVILLRVGRWDEAQDALLSALKLESFHYAEASYNLGRVYSARGENDLAIREWRRAISVDPAHHAAAQALASFAGQGVVETSEAGSEGGLTRKPQGSVDKFGSSSTVANTTGFAVDARTYDFLQRARNSRERGRLLEAVEYYQQVISRQNGYFPPANLELSYALINLNRIDEAIASL